ncbi:MAG: tyrosine-type recombinase/integrase [Nitrospirales bacterium]
MNWQECLGNKSGGYQGRAWLSTGEEERLLQMTRPWMKDIVLFALDTGMRMGEIRELTWEGVDLFRKTVTVYRSKNGERRTIPMTSLVPDVLKSEAKVRSDL